MSDENPEDDGIEHVEDRDFEAREDDFVDAEYHPLERCRPGQRRYYYAWCQHEVRMIGGASTDRRVAERNAREHRLNSGHSVLIRYRCA